MSLSNLTPNRDGQERASRVLLVDDEPSVRRIVARHLRGAGYDVREASSADEGLEKVGTEPIDLAIIDIQMPGRDGLWLLRTLRAKHPELAMMLLTGVADVEVSVHAMREGASDYLTKPVNRQDLIFAVRRALERLALERENLLHRHHLEELVAERTEQLHEALRGVRRAQEETLSTLAVAAEFRDDDTAAHCDRIATLAGLIGERVRPGGGFVELLRLAAPLHDIGKIGIPDRILRKPGRLTPKERQVIETHCNIGTRILAEAQSEVLAMARTVAATHHERWDGEGYPNGLAEEDIPLEGRIVAVIDVFDALISERCYKPAFSFEKSKGIILEGAGTQFDPGIVDVFLSLEVEVKKVLAGG